MSQLERAYRIDQLLNDRGVVSFDDLLHALEVSRATLRRDLAYLRDRLNAPIVHDRVAGGYRFKHLTQTTARPYELPGLWFSAEEIHALLTMQHLLANLDTGGLLGPHIEPLLARLTALIDTADNPAEEVAKRIRILSLGARHVPLEHFQAVDLFGHTGKLDGRIGNLPHRQRRAAARIAIHPGQHDTGQIDPGGEALRDVHRVLAGQAIDDQQRLARGGDVADGLHLVHQHLIDMQTTGGVQHIDVIAAQRRLLFRAFRDLNGVFARHDRQGIDADLLAKEGIKARVLNMATVKPIDAEAVIAAAKETGRIVTAEEGILYGGLGSAVAEVTAQHAPVPMRMLGLPGFAPTGSVDFLFEHFGLTGAGIAAAARELLGK